MSRALGRGRRMSYGLLAALLMLGVAEVSLRLAGTVVLHKARWIQSDPADGAQFRILCLGDSYTFGIGTEPALFSWPRQLENTLRRENPELLANVYNRGVPGRSSSEVLQELPEHLETIRPHVVCILVGINNFWNFRADPVRSEPERWLAESRIYRSLQVLLGHLVTTSDIPEPIGEIQRKEPDASFNTQATAEEMEARWGKASARWSRDVEAISSLVRAEGGELVVLMYPENLSDAFMAAQEATSRRLDIPLVKVTDAFWEIGDPSDPSHPLISADGHHPNGAGYCLVAELTYASVRTAAKRSRIAWSLRPNSVLPAPSAPDYGSPETQEQMREWEIAVARGQGTNPGLATRFALILDDAGRTAEAIPMLEKIVRGNPGQLLAATSLSRLYRKAGQVERERDLCEQILASRPNDAYFLERRNELENGGAKADQGEDRTTRRPNP